VTRLAARELTLAYDGLVVAEHLDLEVPDGLVTAIVGPNACGKSTLLRALARLLRPSTGAVLLDGREIHRLPTKEVARQLGLLPQTPIAPDGITVGDLVARGRTPHQSLLQQWSHADESAVLSALAATGTAELVDRSVDELSGGQRQRVWIAMALAQETELLLLDEPTTYLDISHQLDVLELVAALQRDAGRTVVIVLHDLNLACRYAHHVVAMRAGEIIGSGPPAEIVTAERVEDVFGLECVVIDDPVSHTPLVVPIGTTTSIGRCGARASSLRAWPASTS
jgi:iron complex transport system ATP-binding protein